LKEEDYFTWAKRAFSKEEIPGKPEILSGVRVVEMATRIFGPFTADLLGQLGAEVIKVEMPGVGDLMRYVTPEGYFWKNASVGFFPQNRNKYHVALDLHPEEGKDLFRRLVAESDVVVENLKAGTMDRWGIGYNQLKEINPSIVYVANTGFGQWGPFSKGRPSYDATAQAQSGMSEITGFPESAPLKAGIYIGDFTGGLTAAYAVLVALYHRERSGVGQFIDVAQAEVLIRVLDWTWIYHGLTGKSRTRVGNRDVAVSPSGIFRCRDGFVAVSASDDDQLRGLAASMGRVDLLENEEMSDNLGRTSPKNVELLCRLIGDWCREQSVREVEVAGEKEGFGAVRVRNARDHHENPHLRERGAVWEINDELYGMIAEYGPSMKMSQSPPRLKWAAKPVGYHNDHVFHRILGIQPDEMERLKKSGVIGKWNDVPGAAPPKEEA
jgi:crotonobetainyl-CoA:carnitine CoA-transferase CaiB-like acyl-CoA transferase